MVSVKLLESNKDIIVAAATVKKGIFLIKHYTKFQLVGETIIPLTNLLVCFRENKLIMKNDETKIIIKAIKNIESSQLNSSEMPEKMIKLKSNLEQITKLKNGCHLILCSYNLYLLSKDNSIEELKIKICESVNVKEL